MVTKVYGRFAPRQAERDHWERVAAARDEEMRRQAAERAEQSGQLPGGAGDGA
ncbi:MAG TPA: hypothetical protein VKA84_11845 [Gemmatimonadaceae bacterium]|nr:hypothetical protein [Gemmatimonadaceae bacterium]